MKLLFFNSFLVLNRTVLIENVEEIYLVTALVQAFLVNSPGRMRRTAVCFSRLVMVHQSGSWPYCSRCECEPCWTVKGTSHNTYPFSPPTS